MVFLELPSPEGRQWNCSRCLALSPFRKGMALCFTHAIRFLLALTWKCLLTFACFYAHLEVDWPLPFELNRPSFLPIGNSRSQGRKSYSYRLCRRFYSSWFVNKCLFSSSNREKSYSICREETNETYIIYKYLRRGRNRVFEDKF